MHLILDTSGLLDTKSPTSLNCWRRLEPAMDMVMSTWCTTNRGSSRVLYGRYASVSAKYSSKPNGFFYKGKKRSILC